MILRSSRLPKFPPRGVILSNDCFFQNNWHNYNFRNSVQQDYELIQGIKPFKNVLCCCIYKHDKEN